MGDTRITHAEHVLGNMAAEGPLSCELAGCAGPALSGEPPVPYYSRDGIVIYHGDCRDILASLPAESVSCCVCSPPFWGLRKYSCPPSIWGGSPDCPHTLAPAPPPRRDRQHLKELGNRDGSHGGAKHSTGEQYGVPGGYAGRKRWQHDGVSRQETPEAWVKIGGGGSEGPIPPRYRRCKKCRKMGVTHWSSLTSVIVDCKACGTETTYDLVQSASRSGRTGRIRWIHEVESAKEGERGDVQRGATCSLCGAWRGWLGLEPTVAMYVCHTIEVLRAIRRVMRKDGVCWWDLDDSRGAHGSRLPDTKRKNVTTTPGRMAPDIPDKSLCLIPQRVAIAAQDDGWIVRSQVIIPSWMPESARDRPTDAYRVVLMLCKSKRYWYDAAAVRVAGSNDSHGGGAPVAEYFAQFGEKSGWGVASPAPDGLRNLGNIWDDIPPSAYPAAHFATFAVEEPERAIRASAPKHICAECGLALPPEGMVYYAHGIRQQKLSAVVQGQPDASEPYPIPGDLPDLRQGVPGPEPESLQQDLCHEGRRTEETGDLADLSDMPTAIQAEESEGDLQPEVQFGPDDTEGETPGLPEGPTPSELEGRQDTRGRVHPHLQPRTSLTPGEAEQVRDGASLGDGGGAGSSPPVNRTCPPQERREERQSAGESTTGGDAATSRARSLPTLPQDVPDSLTCPRCGSSDLTPGLVLDSFIGTGTTAVAAIKLGRRCIGIDASEEYLKQAVTRLTVGDAGVRQIVTTQRTCALCGRQKADCKCATFIPAEQEPLL